MKLQGIIFLGICLLTAPYKFCIVPGMGGSKLYNEKNKKIWPPDNPLQLKELDLKFHQDGQLIIPTAEEVGNLDKIKIDSTASYLLTKNVYYSGMIKYLQNDKHDLSALPYDFRYTLYPKYYTSLYQKYKDFIEKQDEPLIMICHSLGGLVFHHFLSTFVDNAWINKHLRHIYFINVPFGGTPASFYTIIDHLNRNLQSSSNRSPIVSHLTRKIKNLHLFGGLYQTLPITARPFYQKDDMLINLHNMCDFLYKYPQVLENYKLFEKYHLPYRDNSINAPSTIIYCTGKNTTVFFDADNDLTSKLDGDGLIDIHSLTRYQIGNLIEIKGQDHSGVNNYTPLLKMISNIKI
jgi:hypothetical protein